MNVNIKGTLLITKIVAKKMVAGGKGGSIVNISSTVYFDKLAENLEQTFVKC